MSLSETRQHPSHRTNDNLHVHTNSKNRTRICSMKIGVWALQYVTKKQEVNDKLTHNEIYHKRANIRRV
jgi:hypothetical protein